MAAVREFLREVPTRLWVLFGILILLGSYAGWVWSQELHWNRLQQQVEASLIQHDWDAARDGIQQLLAVRPDRPEVLVAACRLARRTGQITQAAQHLRHASQLRLDTDSLATERLLFAAESGSFLVTEPLLRERLEADDPDRIWILQTLVDGYVQNSVPLAAFERINEYLELRPDDAIAWYGRGAICEQLFNFVDAAASYRKVLERTPDNHAARERLAESLLIAGSPNEAAQEFRACLQVAPTPTATIGLAKAEAKLGHIPEAVQLLDARLQEVPNDAVALSERGSIAFQLGELESAADFLKRSLAVRPHDRPTLYSYFQTLTSLKRVAEAADAEKQLAQLDADMTRLKAINAALSSQPNQPDLQHEAAEIFLRRGETDEAIRRLERVLREAPTHLPTHQTLADYFTKTNNPQRAGIHRQALQALGPR
ncbi:tetratricopeptide repeat protein [Tuwongella immobilis]|uniref:Uncharacterized protein n=1 Tax=Tuwongella immobilis TaxID=692036 RepID=A0A6C2YL20_9BACT|nr:tetratricopeptide repeat protein [Tuwongella immobilis]VIP02067.1 tetratricopeptide tpr_1 repeat-containing protein : Uncharacterized protein OS=Isosphaera pallida (strain ATCC 43644 / DSM 9630 / IS1B) GN=Isop_0958 PE=4 SV=1: TPR_11: TPR_16: TPR_14 [Tuwongella immobilis]VTS00288.1 tetratricopeptide tpr_1 repeat-containing protein : Uncharacterized protein OS=Isosphaera pallida (strain ATCC 43644 / DSM 9630 / IS1B) GN=Isop_0958 PE=4 SV=1: TPR_11: TPR_16: TPR_14 [Tuwongella immobilis]